MPVDSEINQCLSFLNDQLRQGKLRQIDISLVTGVDQGQVSRILSRKIKRVSKNVLKICNYANSIGSSNHPTKIATEEMIERMLRIWDQNPERATALDQLLRSIEMLLETGKPPER